MIIIKITISLFICVQEFPKEKSIDCQCLLFYALVTRLYMGVYRIQTYLCKCNHSSLFFTCIRGS